MKTAFVLGSVKKIWVVRKFSWVEKENNKGKRRKKRNKRRIKLKGEEKEATFLVRKHTVRHTRAKTNNKSLSHTTGVRAATHTLLYCCVCVCVCCINHADISVGESCAVAACWSPSARQTERESERDRNRKHE